jgi:hypothetical protein
MAGPAFSDNLQLPVLRLDPGNLVGRVAIDANWCRQASLFDRSAVNAIEEIDQDPDVTRGTG